MRIIFTLFLVVTAVATALQPAESYDEHDHLRGANTEVHDEDRDLLTMGSSSNSLSFSVASTSGSGDFCFDYNQNCIELGSVYTAAYTDTYASGNAFAIAWSEEYLWLHAWCEAYAAAWATVCAFSKADGKVIVETKMENSKKNVYLKVQLDTATTTFAMASSTAVAEAYVGIGSYSFTSVAAYCAEVGNMSPYCAGGTASTDLTQLATASSSSMGQAFALSGSGSFTSAMASIWTSGSSIDNVNGLIAAFAKSWSFAEAAAAAHAIAGALTASFSSSFAAVCIKQHGVICGMPDNAGRGICNSSPEEACAVASAAGASFAAALSLACAEAFVEGYAHAKTLVFLSANVNCKGTPVFTWQCTDAGVGLSCNDD